MGYSVTDVIFSTATQTRIKNSTPLVWQDTTLTFINYINKYTAMNTEFSLNQCYKYINNAGVIRGRRSQVGCKIDLSS